jgi:hypothetical protein
VSGDGSGFAPAQAVAVEPATDAGGVDVSWAPENNRTCPDCGGPQMRVRRRFAWFHIAGGKDQCPAPVVGHLRASIASLEDDLRDRNARVAELIVSRDVARAECRDLHVEWGYAWEIAAERGEAIGGVRDALARARIADNAGRGPDTVLREFLARVEAAIGGVR